MQTEQIKWGWEGKCLTLGVDRCGQGPSVLLLPALSSISTRREMRPLQECLSAHYQAIAIDWPGFGDRPRPPLDWRPPAYTAFLDHVLRRVVPTPHAVVAVGHAAGYALAHAAAHPHAFERLVLIAPTWRGPFPTMMNGRRPFFERFCRLVDLPVIGPLVYALNVNRWVVRYVAAGHVYEEPAWLDKARLRDKLSVTKPSGARFASVRFVTGALDPLASREEFLDLARHITIPVLVVYGAETPRRSRSEMEALAAVSGAQSMRLPHGKLAPHEEFPTWSRRRSAHSSTRSEGRRP